METENQRRFLEKLFATISDNGDDTDEKKSSWEESDQTCDMSSEY